MSTVQEVQPERRRRGRPRKTEGMVAVSTRLTVSQTDCLIRAARRNRTSVSEVLRAALELVIGHPRG
jgi:hypothetical protein